MTISVGHDSAGVRRTLTVGGQSYAYYSLPAAEAAGLGTKIAIDMLVGAIRTRLIKAK